MRTKSPTSFCFNTLQEATEEFEKFVKKGYQQVYLIRSYHWTTEGYWVELAKMRLGKQDSLTRSHQLSNDEFARINHQRFQEKMRELKIETLKKEVAIYDEAIEICLGNRSEACALVGFDRKTMYNKEKQLKTILA